MTEQSARKLTPGEAYQQLVDIVETLRDPGGCPWDAEQTHQSLRPNLLEETYETLEAIDSGSAESLEEELGDLLTQIVFHADMARRSGEFDAASVCLKVAEKLERRHPHVFGEAEKLSEADEVVDRWEGIKREEAGGDRSIVASLPAAMPALAYASAIQRRVMRAGLPWPGRHAHPVEFRAEINEPDESVEERAGDYLLAVVRQVQAAGVDPETALRTAALKLRDRVLRAEELAEDTPLAELDTDHRDRVWDEAGEESRE